MTTEAQLIQPNANVNDTKNAKPKRPNTKKTKKTKYQMPIKQKRQNTKRTKKTNYLMPTIPSRGPIDSTLSPSSSSPNTLLVYYV